MEVNKEMIKKGPIKDKKNDFGIIFWFHLIIIILLYTSWIFFDWKWVSIAAICLVLQFLSLKSCIVTCIEFKEVNSENNWTHYYLEKMGLNLNKEIIDFVTCYVLPTLLIVLAYCWQVIFNNKPLL